MTVDKSPVTGVTIDRPAAGGAKWIAPLTTFGSKAAKATHQHRPDAANHREL